MFNKLTKLAKQWSTYRGLFALGAVALGAPGADMVIEQIILGAAAVAGAYDAARDEAQ